MFKKEYNPFSLREQWKLLRLVIKANVLDRSDYWFELWEYHIFLKSNSIEKDLYFKSEEDFKKWIDDFFNCEYYYYRQIVMRAKKFNDYYLYYLASFISGEETDSLYALGHMACSAKEYTEWVLASRLSFSEESIYINSV
jgi:hypothetical protein